MESINLNGDEKSSESTFISGRSCNRQVSESVIISIIPDNDNEDNKLSDKEKFALYLKEANTPQTLGSIPRYTLLRNGIVRAAHTLSPIAYKLTLMATSLLPMDLSSLVASFTFPEFCKAMDMPVGGKQYKILQDAVTECMKCIIRIEAGKSKKGTSSWEQFTWFSYSKYDAETGRIVMRLSSTLAAHLVAAKREYTKLNLPDMGKLKSKYSLALYQRVLSYKSLQGKGGNKFAEWYFEKNVEHLRFIFGIPKTAYSTMKDFRRRVIESPLKEINKSKLGVTVKPVGIKSGRNITSFRLNCQAEKAPTAAKTRVQAQVSVPGTQVKTLSRTEMVQKEEIEKRNCLEGLYPAEFAELLKEGIDKYKSNDSQKSAHSEVIYGFARGYALRELEKRHPEAGKAETPASVDVPANTQVVLREKDLKDAYQEEYAKLFEEGISIVKDKFAGLASYEAMQRSAHNHALSKLSEKYLKVNDVGPQQGNNETMLPYKRAGSALSSFIGQLRVAN